MSYRRAWLLDTSNRSFPDPVIDAAKGGRGGGLEEAATRCEAGFERPAESRSPPSRPETTRRYWDGVAREAADLIAAFGRADLAVVKMLATLRQTRRRADPRFANLDTTLLGRTLTEHSDFGKHVTLKTGECFAACADRPD
jgi:hypothetical protein